MPSKLVLPDSTLKELETMIGGKVSTDFTDESYLQMPFPSSVGRVDITGNLTGMSKENAVKAILEYNNKAGVYFKKPIEISWQGSSSIAYPKKNYSIDLLNADGSSFEIKFGDWVTQDSFHFKANYIDWTHSLNIVSCHLYEQMRRTRIYGERKPWESMTDETNGSDITDINYRMDNGALGHIDGFPVEIYINGEYQGLFTWNLKKHRANYMMKKSNNKHIQFEFGQSGKDIGDNIIPWDAMEVRNPKGFSEGVEIPDGEVEDSIIRLWTWANTFTDETFKQTYADYINIDFWIDWMIFIEYIKAIDLQGKNTQWCTWDGLIWSPLPYDLDTVFGMHWTGRAIEFPPNTNFVFGQRISKKIEANFPELLKNRYHELREKGIFSVENIVDQFESFMKNIGTEAYKKDLKKWTEIPSNSETFKASLGQKRDWLIKRNTYMDKKYKYNQ